MSGKSGGNGSNGKGTTVAVAGGGVAASLIITLFTQFGSFADWRTPLKDLDFKYTQQYNALSQSITTYYVPKIVFDDFKKVAEQQLEEIRREARASLIDTTRLKTLVDRIEQIQNERTNTYVKTPQYEKELAALNAEINRVKNQFEQFFPANQAFTAIQTRLERLENWSRDTPIKQTPVVPIVPLQTTPPK